MVAIIILLLILGLLINIHELGHFIMAKRAKVHIYEFSFGMGPKLFGKKGKDGIDYSIRAFPIGGYVAMAGEVYDDADKTVKKSDLMCNKPWLDRILIVIAGVVNNFILALVLFFLLSIIWGHTTLKPVLGEVMSGYPAYEAGLTEGDIVKKVNGRKINSYDMFILSINMKDEDKVYEIEVQKANGDIKTYNVKPKEQKDEKGNTTYVFGISSPTQRYYGFLESVKYAFVKFANTIESMWVTIISLFTGAISLKALSGPVGIYTVVDQSLQYGISQIIYLTALLSVNLGFINILPIPAFDGGRALFMIIEKIIGKPINQKIENTVHNIFFILLMILMIYITVMDIIKLF